MGTERLVAHRIRCLTCGDVIESLGAKDKIECSCPDDSNTRIFIAGGLSKPVLGYGYKSEYEDISEWEEI